MKKKWIACVLAAVLSALSVPAAFAEEFSSSSIDTSLSIPSVISKHI